MLAKQSLYWLVHGLFGPAVEKCEQVTIRNWPCRHFGLWVVHFDDSFHLPEDLALVRECSTFEEAVLINVILAPERVGLLADAVEGDDMHASLAAVAAV